MKRKSCFCPQCSQILCDWAWLAATCLFSEDLLRGGPSHKILSTAPRDAAASVQLAALLSVVSCVTSHAPTNQLILSGDPKKTFALCGAWLSSVGHRLLRLPNVRNLVLLSIESKQLLWETHSGPDGSRVRQAQAWMRRCKGEGAMIRQFSGDYRSA